MKKPNKTFITLCLLYAGGILFFALTDPNSLPLPLLMLPFIYIFATLFLTVKTLMLFLPKGEKAATSVALTISILMVLLLVLASLHQLTIRDVLISLALAVVLSWYIAKSKTETPN